MNMSNEQPAGDDPSDQELADIVSRWFDQVQQGQEIDLQAECERIPELAGELRELYGTMMVANAAGSHDSRVAPLLAAAQWKPPWPTRFGNYELIEEIGSGGMGVVYLARQSDLQREVAIKMILPSRLASESDRARFFDEARAAAQLEHPGIVPVYDVGEFQGHPYFTMQYVRGQTLSSQMASGTLPIRQSVRIVSQVARAIDFAHRQGILHRDVKPSNILIDETGRARLTDFGLAKFLDQDTRTGTGAILGTPSYMSPEQAAGRNRQIGPASDIYSIGTVLYALLTGAPPFVSDSPMQLALMIMEQEPKSPRSIQPKIDRDLEMIVVKCLQKPSDLRYATAGALADDLDAYLRDEPIAARSGHLAQIVARAFRETHHAPVLENWGLLWMWHSLVLLIACVATEWIQWSQARSGTALRWPYASLWILGLGAWAGVFWLLRHRMGPVTFVERQIAHVWGASLVATASLFPLEWALGLEPLKLSPLLGVISAMVFVIKAGILSGAFYIQAICLLWAAFLMAAIPTHAHLIFGLIAAGCFFFPGLKYYRQRAAG
jgi:serine/threonine-protein kinase